MNVFGELPASQQIDILTKWLTYADIAELDSATCSTTHRKELHHILSSPDCTFTSRLTVDNQALATWIIERHVKLRDILLTYNLVQNSLDRILLLESIGKFIETFKLSWGWDDATLRDLQFDEICYDICRTCTNLHELKLCDAKLDGVLSLFIHNNKNLQMLSLEGSTNVTNSILAACASSTSLRVLHIYYSTYSSTVPFVCSGRSLCTDLHISKVLLEDAQLCTFCQCFPVVRDLQLTMQSGSSLAVIASHCVCVQRGVFGLQIAPTVEDVRKIATSWVDIAVLHIVCVEDFQANTVLSILMRGLQLQYLHVVNYSAGALPWCTYKADEQNNCVAGSQLVQLHASFLSEVELQHIVKNCKSMHKLLINHTIPTQLAVGCAEFALQSIVGSSITSVTLDNITNLTEPHVLPLRNLHELSLSNVHGLTDNAITTVVAQSPLLRMLHIENCSGITYGVVLPVIKSCAALRNVVYLAHGVDHNTVPPAVQMLEEVVFELYPHLVEFSVSL